VGRGSAQQQEEAAAPGGEGCGKAQQQLFRRFEAVADKLLSDSEDDDEIHAWVVAQLFHGASPGATAEEYQRELRRCSGRSTWHGAATRATTRGGGAGSGRIFFVFYLIYRGRSGRDLP